jgi:hypothetical protein
MTEEEEEKFDQDHKNLIKAFETLARERNDRVRAVDNGGRNMILGGLCACLIAREL